MEDDSRPFARTCCILVAMVRTPHRPEALGIAAQAAALVKKYPECFWFWRTDAQIQSLEDVRLVIEHLRRYGGHSAWLDAQDLHRCLLPLFK